MHTPIVGWSPVGGGRVPVSVDDRNQKPLNPASQVGVLFGDPQSFAEVSGVLVAGEARLVGRHLEEHAVGLRK